MCGTQFGNHMSLNAWLVAFQGKKYIQTNKEEL